MTRQPEQHWIPAEGGIGLHAWVYRPDQRRGEPAPAVSMAHGFGAIKDQGLIPYAQRFARAGFVVIAHDHRGFGLSGGWPRNDIDPWRQILDWRRVITYLRELDGVDPDRIGIWGSSYAGGHALVLAGSDRRVKAVVSQIPTISGYQQGLRRVAPEDRPALQERFNHDDAAQMHGSEPVRQAIVSTDPNEESAYRDPAMSAFEKRFPIPPMLEHDHKITLRSTLKAQMYDPGVWSEHICPTPLLMVVGTQDTVTPADLALTAFERAGHPKKLITYPGGHFDAYLEHFETTSGAAEAWFTEHLIRKDARR